MIENVAHDVFEIAFGAFHVVFEIGKGHLGLDHPKFGKVAGSVGIFCAKCRSEGVDIGQGASERFAIELS